jgi:N-acetylmuramoyl-L-alanine amidase
VRSTSGTAVFLLALPSLLAGCRHEPTVSGVHVGELRREIAGCPVPLTDAALDDLATYQACSLPPALSRLVRNDYADDEMEIPDLGALRRHAGQVPRSTFEAQLRRFVDPLGVLAAFVVIDAERALLLPDPVLAPEVAVPFAPEPESPLSLASACGGDACAGRLVSPLHPERPYRAARRAELLAAAAPGRPLAGLRVVIDPGHAGGAFGVMEERHVVYRPAPGAREIVIQEGDLTLRTALELREKLAARGAEITLTRDAPEMVHPFPLHAFRPFAERLLRRIVLDPQYAQLERRIPAEDRLRLHAALAVFAVKKQNRFESLRWRARAASRARPDLVLSIHYDAAPFPTGERGPQQVLAMVSGFPDAGRLYNPFYRFRALEAAFAVDDFDAAAHLGVLCVRAMSERLGFPVASENRYPDHLPIRDVHGRQLGVDAWDGALLRYLDAPAVLTEGPYVNERDEMERLEAALAAAPGTPGTHIELYADALASCVETFTARWLGSERNPFGPM